MKCLGSAPKNYFVWFQDVLMHVWARHQFRSWLPCFGGTKQQHNMISKHSNHKQRQEVLQSNMQTFSRQWFVNRKRYVSVVGYIKGWVGSNTCSLHKHMMQPTSTHTINLTSACQSPLQPRFTGSNHVPTTEGLGHRAASAGAPWGALSKVM